jgi:hypothetical protein
MSINQIMVNICLKLTAKFGQVFGISNHLWMAYGKTLNQRSEEPVKYGIRAEEAAQISGASK